MADRETSRDLGAAHRKATELTIRLAGELGVKKIVMMSGLPPAAPGDRAVCVRVGAA